MADISDLDKIIALALEEDLGDGDHTSNACIPETATGQAYAMIKADGIIAGVELAERIFHTVDSSLKVEALIPDGTKVKKGDIVLKVYGRERSILRAERVVLNFMQRMSGIATQTNRLCNKISQYNTKLLDTRKTTPGHRMLEKWAVRIGGGTNHRIGLYDMVMLKDNHIDFAGGIEKAIQAVHEYLEAKGKKLKIEIEVRNFEELQQVLAYGGVDRVMLDNFNPEDLKKAVEMVGNRFETEASGGITEEVLELYAATGVDYISMGALTNNIKSLDISLKAETHP